MLKYITSIGLMGLLINLPLTSHASDTSTALESMDKINQAPAGYETRGVLKARQTADLAAGMSARILKAPYKPGQRFKRGSLLIQFDCERLKAERNAGLAAKAAVEFKHANIKELLFAGAAGELEETLAKAEVQQSVAELAVIKARLKNCEIRAPYSGIVQDKHISVYDTPALNTPLLSIIRDGKPEIKLIAPSAWMAWVKSGSKFTFTIDETNKTYPAAVLRTGASVDPVSQTIELSAKFTTAAPGAMAGMSGVANFSQPGEKQHGVRHCQHHQAKPCGW